MIRTCLRIDLGCVADNFSFFRDVVHVERPANQEQCCEIAGVVKADAYGLGSDEIGRRLWDAGCRTFFVAHGFEGSQLRAVLPDAVIYVFHGALKGEEDQFLQDRLIPVVHSFASLERWAAFAARTGYNDVALQIDTGMNRLGFRPDEFKRLCLDPKVLEQLNVKLFLSHLACADDAGNPKNILQLDLFKELMNERPDCIAAVPLSLANSAGTLLGTDFHFDICRVGIGLYGGNPSIGKDNPCLSVVTIETEVLQINEISAGETVSYGGVWQADQVSRVATVGVGYADGFLRAGGNNGYVAIGDYKVPIVGRVTMDLLMVDITELPDGLVEVGSQVQLIGDHVPIDEVAANAGTIGYEILTALGQRYKREYC